MIIGKLLLLRNFISCRNHGAITGILFDLRCAALFGALHRRRCRDSLSSRPSLHFVVRKKFYQIRERERPLVGRHPRRGVPAQITDVRAGLWRGHPLRLACIGKNVRRFNGDGMMSKECSLALGCASQTVEDATIAAPRLQAVPREGLLVDTEYDRSGLPMRSNFQQRPR